MRATHEADATTSVHGALTLEAAARLIGTIAWIDPELLGMATGRSTFVTFNASFETSEPMDEIETEGGAGDDALAMLACVRGALDLRGSYTMPIGDLKITGPASAYFDIQMPGSATVRSAIASELTARRAELAAFLEAAGRPDLAARTGAT